MIKSLHIGHIIKDRFEKSDLSVSELAQRINRTRTTIYDIFERKSLDIDLLIELSEALDYDFIKNIHLAILPQEEKIFFVGVQVTESELKKIDLSGKIVLSMERIRKE